MGLNTTISTTAEKIGTVDLQTSAYGVTIPVVYGIARLSGNLIYFNDFKAIANTTTTRSGGKGGGVTQRNTKFTYTGTVMIAIAAGPITSFARLWQDKDILQLGSWSTWTRNVGTYGQAAWAFLTSAHPTEAAPYSGICYAAKAGYDMGESGTLKNSSFEITGFVPVNAGVNNNASPAAIIKHMLTDPYDGMGFPAAMLDDLTATSEFFKYTAAAGILFGVAYTEQSAAREHLSTLMAACNSDFVWSGGKLKIIPYADSNVSGSSTGTLYNFTANVTPLYNLTDQDFLASGTEDPVKCSRKANSDAWNQVQVEWLDSSSDYNTTITEAKDQANIEQYGLRTADPIAMHFINTKATAQIVAQNILQTKLYLRNEYQFKLGWRYALLEPMDLVTLTDANLGLVQKTVRITKISEDDNGMLTVNAIEWPFGVATPALYQTADGAGFSHDAQVAPGAVTTPTFFQPLPDSTLTGLEVWCAVSSASANWAGCTVWSSVDGTSYQLVQRLAGGSRYGTLTETMDIGSAATCKVQLLGQGGQLLAGSASSVAINEPLCWCEGEFFAYQTATLTAANAYTLGTLKRGISFSGDKAHLNGLKFVRVDEAIARSVPLDVSLIGKTIYFKFTSYNIYGSAEEDLSTVTAYSYVVQAPLRALIDDEIPSLVITAGAITIDCAIQEQFRLSLTANVTTVNFINVQREATVLIEVQQRGSYTITWPTSVQYANGSPYVVSTGGTTALPKIDLVGLQTDTAGIIWSLRASRNVNTATGGGAIGSGATYSVSATPNPAYGYAASAPSINIVATAINGTPPYTYAWTKEPGGVGDWNGSSGNIGGAAFTCSNAAIANPTFSRTGSTNGFTSQNWKVVSTDSLGVKSQVAVEIGLEDNGIVVGGGGDFRCPAVDQVLPTHARADEVKVGDLLDVFDVATGLARKGVVSHSQTASEHVWRVVTESGAALRCSATAPIRIEGGSYLNPICLLGHKVMARNNNVDDWSLVTETQYLGLLPVQHITVEDADFWVGETSGSYLLHHNIKYIQ